MVGCYDLREDAVATVFAYLKNVNSMEDKTVFDVTAIKTKLLAEWVGYFFLCKGKFMYDFFFV